MIAPADVIAQAREWVGVPFLHQGRTRVGADCLGFIAACMDELGSPVLLNNLPANYARVPQALLIDGLIRLCRQVPLQPAALVLIQLPFAEFPSHAAIYTGESIVHAWESNRKVVEVGYQDPFKKRTASIWALPLVVYQ